MKLTQSQIQDLYAFTRKHFVEHYDLQTELVDHLANDIETMWQDKPKLSFEDARDKAFKKFGIFGFMEAIEQKQKAMNKRYMRYFWNELKLWFRLPQVLTTLTLFIIFYVSFISAYANMISVVFYIGIAIWCSYKGIQLNRQFRRRKEKSNKKWMMEEMIYKQAGGTTLVLMSQLYNVFMISEKFSGNTGAVVFFSLAFTILVLICYISFQLIPDKAEELLNETYPEFSL
ncbi:MAG: hypothetical protein Tsb0033_01310 [Winogradskyella sp.]